MTASLKLTAENQSGKEFTKTISYVDPSATHQQMLACAQALNSLTTNTYRKTDLVTTTNLDAEEAGDNG